MRIYVLPLDCKLAQRTLDGVMEDVTRGVRFFTPELVLLPRELRYGTNGSPLPGRDYVKYLVKKGTPIVAVVSRGFINDDDGEARSDYLGLAFQEDRVALARTATWLGRRERYRDLAQTIIHEVLHLGDVEHHNDRDRRKRWLCPMMAEVINPMRTTLEPCTPCRERFLRSWFARGRQRQ